MLCPVDISCKLALKPPSLSRHQQGLVLLSPGDMFCSAHAAAISSALMYHMLPEPEALDLASSSSRGPAALRSAGTEAASIEPSA